MASFFESPSKAAHREPTRSKRGRSSNPVAAQPSTAKSADFLRSDEKISLLGQKSFFPPPLGVKTAKSGEGAAAADVAQRCSQKISFPRFVSRRRPWVFISVSRVFAPAPGSAAGPRITNLNCTTPFFRQPGLRASPQFSSSLTHRLLSLRLACAKAWRLWAPATG